MTLGEITPPGHLAIVFGEVYTERFLDAILP